MKFKVYNIKYNDEVIYWGYTGRELKKRTYEHNYKLRKGGKNILYEFLRDVGVEQVELNVVKEFKTKVQAKQYECHLILNHLFSEELSDLKQKVPRIQD